MQRDRPWDEPLQFSALGLRAQQRSTWHGQPLSVRGQPDAERASGASPPACSKPAAESDPLFPKKSRVCSSTDRLHSLKVNYGLNLLFLIFNVQHVMKGFVVHFTMIAEQFLYRSYALPATQMQAYNAVTNLPWSMKPIVGLGSDIFPILGFNKAPYALITSFSGTAAFLLIGTMSQSVLPVWMLVLFLFLCSLQVVTADALTQGWVTAKINDTQSGRLRTDLLMYTWAGTDICSLIAVVGSGIVIHYFGARVPYAIASIPGATYILLAARGCYEEKRVSSEALRQVRRRFWEQVEACVLSLIIFSAAAVIVLSTTCVQSYVVHGIVSIGMGTVVLLCFSVSLTPVIAKMNAFNYLSAVFSLSIDAAAFYFFTDTPEQYPEGPHLSVFFYTTARGAVQFAFAFVGVYTYQLLSEGWTYRRWVVFSTFLHALANVLNVLMFMRVNVRLGISDPVWILCTTAINSVFEKWRWMPRVVSICYMCPKGMEATFSALLMGCHNLGWAVSANIGALLLSCLGVSPKGAVGESAQFSELWMVSAWGSVVPPVLVLLICWLAPDKRQDVSLVPETRDAATAGSLWRRMRDREPAAAAAVEHRRRSSTVHAAARA
mmetsp:Transcript_25623/g.74070  ORF Transcript_25623/g.74070 Transcript_25623/m.74070 type:complete len:606 (+) Transcript_25623:70-1887(+)|eukprot:CAMPEP_0168400920 /NCGR_PEP_ID=MMETSP0228-20121227/22844_1 /TAXON_ID=133427 /ORGANISM="Protoceratium reticulatum, Strain CCCM 535 (=CCMP 1889)" /LENGTH=605 /DNA_ID=CAMNT_0008414471 /DNA_START=65 /DNA_END=1882 /DNA_ORIENTATION=+